MRTRSRAKLSRKKSYCCMRGQRVRGILYTALMPKYTTYPSRFAICPHCRGRFKVRLIASEKRFRFSQNVMETLLKKWADNTRVFSPEKVPPQRESVRPSNFCTRPAGHSRHILHGCLPVSKICPKQTKAWYLHDHECTYAKNKNKNIVHKTGLCMYVL